jgi:TonB family protein
MKRLGLVLLILFPLLGSAQVTQADIESRLLHKRMILRGMYAGDSLAFDAKGQPAANYGTASFTLSGVQIDKVRIKGTSAVLEGQRFGLRYVSRPKKFEAVEIGKNEHVRITLDLAGVSDCAAALDKLFTTDMASLAPMLPDYWKPFFGLQAPRSSPMDIVKINDPLIGKKFDATAARVTAPILLKSSKPEYNDEAMAARVEGTSTIAFIVDANGQPEELTIKQPIGVGLDERALDTVKKYRFQPANRDGKPVAVRLMVEVECKIYR